MTSNNFSEHISFRQKAKDVGGLGNIPVSGLDGINVEETDDNMVTSNGQVVDGLVHGHAVNMVVDSNDAKKGDGREKITEAKIEGQM